MPSNAQSHSRLSRQQPAAGSTGRPLLAWVTRPCAGTTGLLAPSHGPPPASRAAPLCLHSALSLPCPPCAADHRGTARLALAGRSVGSRPSRPPAATNADRLTSPATAVTPPQPRSVPPLQCAVPVPLCRAPHTHERATAALTRALIGPRTPPGPSTPPCAPRALTPAHLAHPTRLRRGHTPPTWTAKRDAPSRGGGCAGQLPRSRRVQIELLLLQWPEPPRRAVHARRCARQSAKRCRWMPVVELRLWEQPPSALDWE